MGDHSLDHYSEICVIHKNRNKNTASFVAGTVLTDPNPRIYFAIVVPFKNPTYLLTVIDHCSRNLELFTLKNISSESFTKAFMHYVSTHGITQIVLTD